MTNKPQNDGGPAFPTKHRTTDNGFDLYGGRDGASGEQHGPGLTKREYFAGLAMQGFISTHNALDANISTHPDPYDRYAANSVAAADALLAELGKESK